MGILIIAFIAILTLFGLYFLFRLLKRFFQKRARIIGLFIVLGSILVSITIYKQFFVKMEFVQSKVYPDLYLIKNPAEEKFILHSAIKEKVNNLIKKNDTSNGKQQFTLRFYEYSNGDWGESGTTYFLEHKERPDGMTAELLEYYPEYKLAKFSLKICKENETGYLGELNYYKNNKRIKTDTLLHSCTKEITK